MTFEEMKKLPPKEQQVIFAKVTAARKSGKTTNYASTYGAAPATIARAAGVPLEMGKRLHKAYWEVNWSIEATARAQTVKTVDGQKWLKNPVSGLWYSLRHEKDRWSTLNQGTGVWVFDTWLKGIRDSGMPVIGQFHDEYIGRLKTRNKERAERVTMQAMDDANKALNLNQQIRCDCAFGKSYADIH